VRHKLICWLCVWGVLGGTFGGLACSSSAQINNSWIDGSGKWEVTNKWSLGTAPSTSDSVDLITNAGNKTVTIDAVTSGSFPATLTISNLLLSALGGSTNTLVLSNAGTSTPLHLQDTFTISSGGVLLVTNSALLFDAMATCCHDFEINGVVTMQSGLIVASNNENRINLGVGTNGFAGRLTISNGTVLSREVIVGFNNGCQGTLTVAGGTVSVSGVGLDIGFFGGGSSPSTGTVFVTGGQLIVNNGSFNVGDFGVGQMTVSNGIVQARDVAVANDSGSQGTLTMAGGIMLVSSNLLVGSLSNVVARVSVSSGSLFVTNAAHSAVTEVRYGTLMLTTGGVFATDSLLITNASGSFLNNGGTFNITGQAQVDQGTQTFASGTTQVSSNFVIGSTANSTGTVIVTGTLVAKDGTLGIGNNGTITSGGGVGRMIISNGTLLVSRIALGNSAGARCDLLLEDGGVISDGGCPSGNCRIVINSLGFGDIGGTVDTCNTPMSLGVTGPSDYTVSGNANDSFQDLYVGDTDMGTFTMAGGVVNICQQFVVGNQGPPFEVTPSVGAVWINGGQLTITNSSIYSIIGNSGVGQMTMSNGTVTAATVVVGNNSSNPGTVTVAGGAMTVLGGLTLGDCSQGMIGIVTVAGGNLFVTNAAHNAVLDVRSGRVTLSGGLLQVDKLVMTNSCGLFVRGGGSLLVGSLLLDPNLDADGDGMPNGWELSHGLDPLNAADANWDNDGDGLSNLREYQLGTDPNDPSSPYRITAITKEGANMRVTWSTVGGNTNVLQANSGVAGGNYTNNFGDLSPQLIISGSIVTSTNFVDPGGATIVPSRYYRIRVVP